MSKVSRFWPKGYRSNEASRAATTTNTSLAQSLEHSQERAGSEGKTASLQNAQDSSLRDYDDPIFRAAPKKKVDLKNFAESLITDKNDDLRILLESR